MLPIKFDVTIRSEFGALTLTFDSADTASARERLDTINFILKPLAGAEKKSEKPPVAKPAVARASAPAPEGK